MADDFIKRLQVVIDAENARRGAKVYNRATKSMQQDTIKTKGAIGGLNKTMGGMGRAVTSLVGVLGGMMVLRKMTNTVKDFEFTMAKLRGVTSANAETMARFIDSARKMGATTRYTAAEAGESLLFLARAGFDADEAITALPGTLNLASAGMLDLGFSADIASNIMAQFGMQASQVSRIGDILVNTANSANTNVEQLAEAMKMAGPVAGALGISLEETSAAVGALGDAGIQASMAGTNLRGIFAALLGPTDTAKKAMAEMGLTIKDLDPTTQSLAKVFDKLKKSGMDATQALEIFRRRNAAAALVLADSADKVKELTEANEESSGVAERNAKIMENTLAGSFKALASAIDEVILKTGDEGFAGAMKKSVDAVTGQLRTLDKDVQTKGLEWISLWEKFKIGADVALSPFTSDKTGPEVLAEAVIQQKEYFKALDETIEKYKRIADFAKRGLDYEKEMAEVAKGKAREKRMKAPLSNEELLKIAQTLKSIGDMYEKANELTTTQGMAVSNLLVKEKERQEIIKLRIAGGREAVKWAEIEKKAKEEINKNAIKEATALGLKGAELSYTIKEIIANRTKGLEKVKSEREITKELLELEKRRKEEQMFYLSLGRAMVRPFEDVVMNIDKIIQGTYDWKSAAINLTKSLARLVLQYTVLEPIAKSIATGLSGGGTANTATKTASAIASVMGGSTVGIKKEAKGDVFNMGSIVPFANGGVVNSPTFFPMSKGRTGLMGESGPEAIMPLERGADGKLGVAGGSKTVIVNIKTPNAESFRRNKNQIKNMINREF